MQVFEDTVAPFGGKN